MRLHSSLRLIEAALLYVLAANADTPNEAQSPAHRHPFDDAQHLRSELVLHRRFHGDVVPGSYIVEFEKPSEGQSSFQAQLTSVFQKLESKFEKVVQTLTYDSEIFYGAAFRVEDKGAHADDVRSTLNKHQAVKSVRQNRRWYPNGHMEGRRAFKRDRQSNTAVDSSQVLNAQHASDISDVGDAYRKVTGLDAWGIHTLTGVKQQHDLGNYGQGIHICSPDTGVDAGHNGLNGGRPVGQECIGRGCPITGGINFVGDNYDGKTYRPGPLKASSVRGHQDCFHGTYTAGHFLANDTVLGIVGSAPRSTASIYQITPCTLAPGVSAEAESSSDEIIYKAYEQALKDRCSIFSFSFGSQSGWSTESDSVDKLAAKGILPVISAGNSGENGAYTINCAGCAKNAVAVASLNLPDNPGWEARVEPPLPNGPGLILYNSGSPTGNETYSKNDLPLWFSQAALQNSSVEDDGCQPIDQDLKDKVAVLYRGTCLMTDKADNAAKAGASHVLIITDDRPVSYHQRDNIYFAMLSRQQGLDLYQHYKNNSGKVKISFGGYLDFNMLLTPNTEDGSLTSNYSSWGLTWDSIFKPDIMAPGGRLPSLNVLPDRYRVVSGTSGAAPYFAGAAAVFQQVKGLKVATPDVIKRAFLLTARPVPTAHDNPRPMSVFQQGHGLMDLTAAIELTSTAEPHHFSVGDTPRANLTQTIRVTNNGPAHQQYKTEHVPAQSFFATQERSSTGYKDPTQDAFLNSPEPNDGAAQVIATPDTFTLAPGRSVDVELQMLPPTLNDRINLYSGWMRFDASQADGSLAVAYVGVAGDLNAVPTFASSFDIANTTTPALYTSSLAEQIRNDSSLWTLEGDDYPSLVWQQQVGSPYLQCDLVKSDINFKASQPIIDDPDCCSSALPDLVGRDVEQIPIVGQLLNNTNLPRDYNLDFSVGGCDIRSIPDPRTGEWVKPPPGKYRVLLRIQKLYATSFQNSDDWSSYLSHAFEVK